jgi:hypothetical protein
VRTHRSANAFAWGERGGIRIALMPDPVSTSSKDRVNCPAPSRMRNRNPGSSRSRSRKFRAAWVVHGPVGLPTDHGVGFHDQEDLGESAAVQCAGEHREHREHREDRAVGLVELRPGDLSLQDRDLVARAGISASRSSPVAKIHRNWVRMSRARGATRIMAAALHRLSSTRPGPRHPESPRR